LCSLFQYQTCLSCRHLLASCNLSWWYLSEQGWELSLSLHNSFEWEPLFSDSLIWPENFMCTFVKESMCCVFWFHAGLKSALFLWGNCLGIEFWLGLILLLNIEGIASVFYSIQCYEWKVWSVVSFIFKWPLFSFLKCY
jgi:hypothetical protein